jgi:hypothetical protein
LSTQLSVAPLRRSADVRAGIRVEIFTVALMTVEAVIAIGVGTRPKRTGWLRMRR